MTGTAKATVFFENERVIVTEWRMAPGTSTGWHRHGHDYVVVPLVDGKVTIKSKTGSNVGDNKKGVPYFRQEGVEHDVINTDAHEYTFIEVELK